MFQKIAGLISKQEKLTSPIVTITTTKSVDRLGTKSKPEHPDNTTSMIFVRPSKDT